MPRSSIKTSAPAFAPGRIAPLSPRNFVVHLATERGVRHCRVRLGRFTHAIKAGGWNPANPRVSMLIARDAKLHDGIIVRLRPLHPGAHRDKAINGATSGDARRVEDEQLAGLDVLQRKPELHLSWVGRFAGKPDFPFALVEVS